MMVTSFGDDAAPLFTTGWLWVGVDSGLGNCHRGVNKVRGEF